MDCFWLQPGPGRLKKEGVAVQSVNVEFKRRLLPDIDWPDGRFVTWSEIGERIPYEKSWMCFYSQTKHQIEASGEQLLNHSNLQDQIEVSGSEELIAYIRFTISDIIELELKIPIVLMKRNLKVHVEGPFGELGEYLEENSKPHRKRIFVTGSGLEDVSLEMYPKSRLYQLFNTASEQTVLEPAETKSLLSQECFVRLHE
jgi:hypothetical protein